MSHAWTPERVETLKRMWAEGRSCTEVAVALGDGCTRNMVIGKVRRLKLPTRPTTSFVRSGIKVRCSTEYGRPRATLEITPRTVASASQAVVALLALEADMCRWPTGEGDNFSFCCHPVKEGRSYCDSHCAEAYVKPLNKPRPPREARRLSGFDGWEMAA